MSVLPGSAVKNVTDSECWCGPTMCRPSWKHVALLFLESSWQLCDAYMHAPCFPLHVEKPTQQANDSTNVTQLKSDQTGTRTQAT